MNQPYTHPSLQTHPPSHDSPHHPISSFPDVRQPAVARPHVKGLPSDHLWRWLHHRHTDWLVAPTTADWKTSRCPHNQLTTAYRPMGMGVSSVCPRVSMRAHCACGKSLSGITKYHACTSISTQSTQSATKIITAVDELKQLYCGAGSANKGLNKIEM